MSRLIRGQTLKQLDPMIRWIISSYYPTTDARHFRSARAIELFSPMAQFDLVRVCAEADQISLVLVGDSEQDGEEWAQIYLM